MSEENITPDGWIECVFGDLLDYLQPIKYIVNSTNYCDSYPTPVLTAGKSFIKGYTKETDGIFDELPTIIFDDFTTASKFVNFPFKVKSSAMKILVPSCSLVNLKFIFFLMQSIQIRSDTHKRYWISVYAKRTMLLPPRNEQKRIVAKIEELFSELDKGVESLKTARAQLKIYRQAVLKHAFEGKLTAEWREDNKDKLETADELLERIQKEREARYQQQLEDWQTSVKEWEINSKEGKKPAKPRIQKETTTPSSEELSKFSELPIKWKWVKMGELVWSVKDGPHYTPKYSKTGVPFITGGNVRQGGVDFKSAKNISKSLHKELSLRCKPELGDILYTKGGTTGIAHVNSYNFDFNVWVHVAVLKITNSLNPFYLQHALNSPNCYAQSQKYTHGVGNQDLGLTRMVNIILPLCSEEEQKQIVNIFEQLTSKFDDIERNIELQIQKSKALRQSILKKAFLGKLVAQDPNDEPASVLLEHIKAEKNDNKKKKDRAA